MTGGTGFDPVAGGDGSPATQGNRQARRGGVPDPSHIATGNPRVRAVAVGIVRAALQAQSDGDSPALAVLIRRRLAGLSKRDRLRFETALAATAALFASMLPPAEREALLALAEADTRTLAAAIGPALLSDALAAAQGQVTT